MAKENKLNQLNDQPDNFYVNRLLSLIEIILRIAVPIAATIFVVVQFFLPTLISNDIVLKLILLIVATLSISEGISKFLSINHIKRQINDIYDQNIPYSINELRNSIDKLYSYEMPNQQLLELAHKSGIIEIAPRNSKNWLSELNRELIGSKGTIDICTIGMPSLIANEATRTAILERAERHDIRVLLLDPDCDEADRRAKIERPLGTKTIADIKATIAWLKEKMAKNGRFRVHLYQIPPILSLFITSEHIYMEPYHFGRPEGIEGCIGGHVPNLKIKNDPGNSSVFFKAHFEYLWKDTRGGRLNLNFEITEHIQEQYLKLKNNNDIDIAMDGWVLAAHGVQKSLTFDPEFIWEKNEEITINLNKKQVGENRFYWDIGSFGSQTIFTMQNNNNITVAQWSPETINSSCI